MKNNKGVFLKYMRFLSIALITLIVPAVVNAIPIYNYTLGGEYSLESPDGVFTLGQIIGSASISDTFDEITDPNSPYDEWNVLSWEFTAGGYQFEGENVVIERYYQNSYLTLDEVFFGYSEFTQIIFTGPYAIPLEHMYFGEVVYTPIEMTDGTIFSLHTLQFFDREIVDVPEPDTLALLAMGLGLVGFAGHWGQRKGK